MSLRLRSILRGFGDERNVGARAPIAQPRDGSERFLDDEDLRGATNLGFSRTDPRSEA
jgi:hypothetical protein